MKQRTYSFNTLIAAFLLLLTTMSIKPVAPTIAQEEPANGPVRVERAWFYKPPQDGTPPATIAHDSAFMILTKNDESYRDAIRGIGYQGKILQYVLANEVEGPLGAASADAPCETDLRPRGNQIAHEMDSFCRDIHPHEDWFLHNGAGERLISRYAGGQRVYYHMNPASDGWRSYMQHSLYLLLAGDAETAPLGYDGIFLDNVAVSIYKEQSQLNNSDGVIRELADDAQYRAAWIGFLQVLSDKLRPNWPIWANMIGQRGDEAPWDPYMAYLDGGMMESFAIGWGRPIAADPVIWEQQLAQAERVLAMGKGYLAVARGWDDTIQPFALASYLLISDGHQSYFRFTKDSSYATWETFDNYTIDLGVPLGPRYQIEGGQWQRDFQGGSLIVDPQQRSMRILPIAS